MGREAAVPVVRTGKRGRMGTLSIETWSRTERKRAATG